MLALFGLFFLFVLKAPVLSCAEISIYNIYPAESCDNEIDCLTLLDIMKDREKYLASNTTLFLHNGDHILQGDVSAFNITNFTIQGNHRTSSIVTCINSSISLNIMSLRIISVHFNHCSINLFDTNATIQNSKFENGNASNGGALAAFDSRVSFSGMNFFTGNMADKFEGYGGAIYVNQSELIFNGITEFTRNMVYAGGAVCAVNGSNVSFNGTSTFTSNEAHEGGAVAAIDGDRLSSESFGQNTLTFYGNTNFMNNHAHRGGVIFSVGLANVSMYQTTSFTSNKADLGAAVCAWRNSTLIFDGKTSFRDNKADYDGGAVYGWNNIKLVFNGSTSFVNNSALRDGGTVDIREHTSLNFSGNCRFVNNIAGYDGGAMHVWIDNKVDFNGNVTIVGNKAAQGGGILLSSNSALRITDGILSLSQNTAGFGGGIAAKDSTIECTGTLEVSGNNASNGGGLYLQASSITAQGVGWFDGNTASHGGYGGAVFALGSTVRFGGNFQIADNKAGYGGGLALLGINDKALMFLLKAETHLNISQNFAYRRGGAIYVEDNPFTFCTFDETAQIFLQETCFLHLIDEWYNCDIDSPSTQPVPINLTFQNNTAVESGNTLYGGNLESCVICASPDSYFGLGSTIISSITDPGIDVLSEVSSDPYKVCLCNNDQPQCDKFESYTNITVYPGQVLFISVVAVGQMNSMVPSVIRAVPEYLGNNSDFRITQPAENPKSCNVLQYPLLSATKQKAYLSLYSDEPCSTLGYPLILSISFLLCPVGFTLSQQGNCVCEERLQEYTQNCSIQTLTISRSQGDSFWVGAEENGLILHPHCPLDYCSDEPISFTLNSTDMQCAHGRSGVLCGACQSGHSLALGSSRCLSGCSNEYLALLLAFAFAGVVLVVFLFLCRLTIAEGTLSGLIFYANVIAVNQAVLFPSGEQNVLTVFIAWLNLDLGIETCFIEGLNAYYSTWLQFVFPIYIWLMVGVIIVLADRSTFFARIIGSTNPVAILATLFLLSYTKLLRAIVAAFSFTTLDYPDDERKVVWLYDGNIRYLDRHDAMHITLFLFSILAFLCIFLPYTLLLLCGQWIQRKLWWLSPTKQLYMRSFLDAHYAPYKEKHCYWTGLLLVIRFVILFITTIIDIRSPQDPFSSLLVILIFVLILTVWGWVISGLYKKWHLDLLEASFILNLLVLVGGTYQVRQSGGNQAALVHTSVGVVFVTFIAITVSTVAQRVKKKIVELKHRQIQAIIDSTPSQDDKEDSIQLAPAIVAPSTVVYSVLEIDTKETSGEIILRSAAYSNAEN